MHVCTFVGRVCMNVFSNINSYMYVCMYVRVRIKRRNDEVTQMKLALSLNKDLHVRAVQEKAAEDREERIRKLNMSRLGLWAIVFVCMHLLV